MLNIPLQNACFAVILLVFEVLHYRFKLVKSRYRAIEHGISDSTRLVSPLATDFAVIQPLHLSSSGPTWRMMISLGQFIP
jgi:hypothetical protein